MKSYWKLWIVLIVAFGIQLWFNPPQNIPFINSSEMYHKVQDDYVVGRDIEPGLYTVEVTNPTNFVTYTEGILNSKIDQVFNFGDGPFYNVELTEGQYVIPPVYKKGTKIKLTKQDERVKLDLNNPADGVYLTGQDIETGTYDFTSVGKLTIELENHGGSGYYVENCNQTDKTYKLAPKSELTIFDSGQACGAGKITKTKADKVKLPSFKQQSNTNFDQVITGDVVVGEDIPAGTYDIIPEDGLDTEATFIPRDTLHGVIPNISFAEHNYYTLYDGDRIKSEEPIKYQTIDKIPQPSELENGVSATIEYFGGTTVEPGLYNSSDYLDGYMIIPWTDYGYTDYYFPLSSSDGYNVNSGDIIIGTYNASISDTTID